MQSSLRALELWETEQRARLIQERVERRALLKRFALVVALIALTLGVAMVLAAWAPQELSII